MSLYYKLRLIVIVFLATTVISPAKELRWADSKTPLRVGIITEVDPVVNTALEMLDSDMMAVLGQHVITDLTGKGDAIIVTQLDRATPECVKVVSRKGIPVDRLRSLTDGFNLSVHGSKIYITGANGRGTAYGLLELSRMAGVSPWVWWGDVVPEKRQSLSIDSDFETTQGASVEYRGVFINDEDWSLRPWSCTNHEPGRDGDIGPGTYRRIFELLLRLRANAIWPAMHPGTTAFFKVPGNKAMADSCGIVIGTSHCEPLLRNNVDEWIEKDRGRFNFRTNRDGVKAYWTERLREVKDSKGGNMFTIGMRGIHDGAMEGYKTMDEKTDGLQQVIDDQQELIREYVGDPAAQMQVFVPYKEVLDIYQRGLRVPEHVTLMWCDDNYGYMTRLSNPSEQKRSGGAGVYYHLSYWGRPHDYLWLTTTQPGLLYNEMKEAYDHNARKLWIVNVHDPKVAGYDLELFLDMAWNIGCVESDDVEKHYMNWLSRQFGSETARLIHPAMMEFYRLCGQRKPEFMGWSQTELDKRVYARGLSPVADSEFSMTEFGNELERYMERYESVADIVNEGASMVRPELRDAYFAAIQYPVNSAAEHAVKMLESQKARRIASGSTTGCSSDRYDDLCMSIARSQNAYQNIRKLTACYNDSMAGGKWRGSMNMRPRDLPFASAPVLPMLFTDEEIARQLGKDESKSCHPLDASGAIARNASDYDGSSGDLRHVGMLGHSMKSVALSKGSRLEYRFTAGQEGDALLRIALIPTQANDGGDIRYSVTIDNGEPTVLSIKEPFRSEQWKKNVLRGQALKEIPLSLERGDHTMVIEAIDSHIVIDQWMIDFNKDRKFYLFPVE